MTGAMTDLLAQLMATGNTALAAGFVVFLRVGAVMATLPAFGEHSVPQRVRLMLTLAFTAIVFPAVADDVLARLAGRPPPVPVLLAEITTGLALGMALRLFVAVLQTAGSIAAQSTSLAQILGSAGVEPMPAMGHLMVVSGLAVAVMSGLHLRVSEALIGSYTVFPPGVTMLNVSDAKEPASPPARRTRTEWEHPPSILPPRGENSNTESRSFSTRIEPLKLSRFTRA